MGPLLGGHVLIRAQRAGFATTSFDPYAHDKPQPPPPLPPPPPPPSPHHHQWASEEPPRPEWTRRPPGMSISPPNSRPNTPSSQQRLPPPRRRRRRRRHRCSCCRCLHCPLLQSLLNPRAPSLSVLCLPVLSFRAPSSPVSGPPAQFALNSPPATPSSRVQTPKTSPPTPGS